MSAKRSNDRSSLCAFMFTDGRMCRIPRRVDHPYLCAFHARKEAQTLGGDKAGKDIAYHLSGGFLSACDLSSALGRLFSAVAQGHVKPKTASTLAYLGQTLAQILPLSQQEYIQAYDTDAWRDTVRTSHEESANYKSPKPQSPPAKPEPAASPAPATKSDESPATQSDASHPSK